MVRTLNTEGIAKLMTLQCGDEGKVMERGQFSSQSCALHSTVLCNSMPPKQFRFSMAELSAPCSMLAPVNFKRHKRDRLVKTAGKGHNSSLITQGRMRVTFVGFEAVAGWGLGKGGRGGHSNLQHARIGAHHTWRERLALRNDKRWEVCCQLLFDQLNA